MNTECEDKSILISETDEQKNYYESIIESLTYENSKKDMIILNLKKNIKNLEIKLFSASVPPKVMKNPQVKAVANPQARLQTKSTLKRWPFRSRVANMLQKFILFCGKFARGEHSQRKLMKLTMNPRAYFADSKHAFLRPLCKLFDD